MPIFNDPQYGPKPSLTLAGGSPTTLAQGSYPFMPSGGRGIELSGYRHISHANVYRKQPWVGAVIRRKCESIAGLPLQVFQYLDAAGDTAKRDRRHGLAELLAKPRPGRRAFHLAWDMALSLHVQGNWVAWKRRPSAGAPPAELWTLDWRQLVPIMDGLRVLGWKWLGKGIPGLRQGEIILLENTVHIAYGGPGGGDIGVSPLEQLQTTIRSEDALQRYSEAAMRNGTRFGVAVILDPKVKTDRVVREGIREEIRDAHGGVDQAFQSAILGGGITDIKPLGQQSAVEAELISQRTVNRTEIAGVIGLPLPLAGVLDSSNYASIREVPRLYYGTLLRGDLGLIAASLQAQLLDDEPGWADDDRFLEHSLDAVLKGDTKERWETYGLALDHGGMSLNDVRRRENLEPYTDPRADEPLIAANNVRPLSAVGTGADDDAGKNVVTSILGLVDKHKGKAFDRALESIQGGKGASDGFDVDTATYELAAELERVGLNGSSKGIAGAAMTNLGGLLDGVTTVDQLLDVATAAPTPAGGPA